ncbi:MAG: DciA family protein [Alphaproteobacteria bacterium]|jgi:hypothetical protein|nr:DciA family protein [Alphaproteobacteria bacterium]MDP7222645.1 DciA family protein [Alphaproteobacteria bacterium]
MNGPQLLAKTLPRITNKVCNRKFVMLGRLLDHWEEIMGKELAGKTQPVKIRYFKARKKNDQPRATLEIAASAAESTALHYRKALIMERLNMIFGGDSWITDIKVVPQVANNRKKSGNPLRYKNKERTLLPSEKKSLDDALATVEDPEIKKKLTTFGKAVLQDRSSGL